MTDKLKTVKGASASSKVNNNEANSTAQPDANALQGTPTSEPIKVEAPTVQPDAIQAGNKKAFDSIQGLGIRALQEMFTILFLAFQDRMAALKSLLGDAFDEAAFWIDEEIAASVINGATMEMQGYDTSGKPKYVKNQLNAKLAALAAPFIRGLGIRTPEQLTAILATRKDNSLGQLARDAYSYAKVISLIPALAKVGLLVNTDRVKAFDFARNEFKNEVTSDFAYKHLMEFAKSDCDASKIKENRISLDEVKTVQAAIKAYNAAVKLAKDDKSVKEPVKLTWVSVFTPAQTVAAPPADLTLVNSAAA